MISGDMLIGEAIKQYPHAAHIMLEYGLQCVGCHVNPYESIADGARSHGMRDEQIAKMIKQINEQTPKEEIAEDGKVVKFTPAAADKARDLRKQDDKEGYGLRIKVIPGGCSGMNYELDFENELKDNDVTYEEHGLKVYVDKDVVKFVNGMTLDYINTLNTQGFKFNNPNAVNTCGCGTSFSA